MDISLSPSELEAIDRSLRQPARACKRGSAERAARDIVEEGWASKADIEDLLYLWDTLIDDIRSELGAARWLEAFAIPSRVVYPRPRSKQASFIGYDSVAAHDVTELLIYLERLGYSVDPLPLAAGLIETIKGKEVITGGELAVLRYQKERHKCVPLVLRVPHTDWARTHRTDLYTTPSGYKIEVTYSDSGAVTALFARAPKYRRQAPLRSEVCELCGWEWLRGDPDSSAAHRKEHAKRMAFLDPKPLRELADERASAKDMPLVLVTSASPRWKHREMFGRARAFKREFRYDFVQWQSESGDDDPTGQGVLFERDGIIVGACAFRQRIHEKKTWTGMQWIWIAPKYRRSGVLASYWPALRASFQDFYVEPPVSPAMNAFLIKMGDKRLLELH